MGRINMGRVIVGGLVAGLIITISEFVLNMYVIEAEMEAALKAMNLPPIGPSQIGCFVALGFLLGIASIWVYAAIRPRFGPGVATATYAALLVWLLSYAYPTSFLYVTSMGPRNALIISVIWGLPEIVIATIAGAWAYTET